MTDIVIADLKRPARGRTGSVRKKSLRDPDGRMVRVLSLDANSATFADDLTIVFERNVARARQENKKLFGAPSGFRAKKK